uniref:Uncharacterized protein n=1 Tax=Arundo donax TaxID=35708 RepID=A0A0A9HAA2_ARUDO
MDLDIGTSLSAEKQNYTLEYPSYLL